jgi:hypothetical protein
MRAQGSRHGISLCEGVLLDKNLSADDIILPDSEKSEYEQQITVCFADETNSFLEQERRYLTIGKDKQLSEYVVEELIRGRRTRISIRRSPKVRRCCR